MLGATWRVARCSCMARLARLLGRWAFVSASSSRRAWMLRSSKGFMSSTMQNALTRGTGLHHAARGSASHSILHLETSGSRLTLLPDAATGGGDRGHHHDRERDRHDERRRDRPRDRGHERERD